jgi:hypothetical protein
MPLALKGVAVLLATHVLPGSLVVRALNLGRNPFERVVMASVLGGPVAVSFYFVALISPWPEVYWVLLVGVDLLAVWFLFRKSGVPSLTTSCVPVAPILLVVLLVDGAYITTAAGLFRLDRQGNFVMDSAFQQDALFHVGLVRSLEVAYPPELLSESGVRALYHVGYDLQVAAWSRYFDVDPFDGLFRVAPLWFLTLLVLSAYLLAQRLGNSSGVAVLSSALIFATGLGFLFHSAPKADWWSLMFMDATLVSVFVVNPLLPALSLFLVGMVCLDDYLREGRRKALAAAVGALSFLFTLKIFLAAHILLALALAAAVSHSQSESKRRFARATLAVLLAATPVLLGMGLQFGHSNTSVGLRPFEIVRYSMELIGWDGWAGHLALVGTGDFSLDDLAVALAASTVWFIGFLGLRVVGLPRLFRDAASSIGSIRRPLALFALVSFPLTLLFRVAPSEAIGLSRGEALNDILWFATEGGILLWFWTAEALAAIAVGRRYKRALVVVVSAFVALPGTVQFFIHRASLKPDVVPAPLVEAALKCREASAPTDVFIEPLDRVRPSLPVYLAGRPVVHDSFMTWDYMFVSREARDFRRHAVSQFWKTSDPGYAAWLLNRFEVAWIFVPRFAKLPAVAEGWTERVFSNEAAELYRVRVGVPATLPVETPRHIPLGVPGHAFLGRGWSPPIGFPRTRRLLPGTADLYLPLDGGTVFSLTLDLKVPHAPGFLVFMGQSIDLDSKQSEVTILAPAEPAPTLRRLELDWGGTQPIRITSITVSPFREDDGSRNLDQGSLVIKKPRH